MFRKKFKTILGTLIICLTLTVLTSCLPPETEDISFSVPYIMRGTWMNEDGTATVVATADNIILSYGYVPGAEMNLAQLMHELKGMYQVTTTNTMLTVRSEQFDLTMYEFIVMGDVMSCVISEKERLQLQRQ